MTIINGTYEEIKSRNETFFEKKVREFKKATRKTKTWVIEHKNEIETVISDAIAVGVVAVPVIKGIRQVQRASAEERAKRFEIYDHSLNRTLYLTRELKLDELVQIKERRAATGESLYEVLRTMGVLSRKNKF